MNNYYSTSHKIRILWNENKKQEKSVSDKKDLDEEIDRRIEMLAPSAEKSKYRYEIETDWVYPLIYGWQRIRDTYLTLVYYDRDGNKEYHDRAVIQELLDDTINDPTIPYPNYTWEQVTIDKEEVSELNPDGIEMPQAVVEFEIIIEQFPIEFIPAIEYTVVTDRDIGVYDFDPEETDYHVAYGRQGKNVILEDTEESTPENIYKVIFKVYKSWEVLWDKFDFEDFKVKLHLELVNPNFFA